MAKRRPKSFWQRHTRLLTGGAITAVVFAVIVSVIALATNSSPEYTDRDGVRVVTPTQARALIKRTDTRGGPPIIIDVRTPAEFASGHIAGARNIDIYDPSFARQLESLDRSKTYFLYCRADNRSMEAASQLHQLGATNVYDLEGGIAEWTSAGYPLTR